MNIYEAATLCAKLPEACIRNKTLHTEEFTIFVAPGSVFRKTDYEEVRLDARQCMSNGWYLVDENGDTLNPDGFIACTEP